MLGKCSNLPLLCLLDSLSPKVFRNKGFDNCTAMSKPFTDPPLVIKDGRLDYPFCFCLEEGNEINSFAIRYDRKLNATIQINNKGNVTFDLDFTVGSNPEADIFRIRKEGKELLQCLSDDCAPFT